MYLRNICTAPGDILAEEGERAARWESGSIHRLGSSYLMTRMPQVMVLGMTARYDGLLDKHRLRCSEKIRFALLLIIVWD